MTTMAMGLNDAYLDAAKEAGITTDAAQAAVEARVIRVDITNFIIKPQRKTLLQQPHRCTMKTVI